MYSTVHRGVAVRARVRTYVRMVALVQQRYSVDVTDLVRRCCSELSVAILSSSYRNHYHQEHVWVSQSVDVVI